MSELSGEQAALADEAQLEREGWRLRDGQGFTAAIGRAWMRGEGETRELGFIAAAGQGNNHMNSVHGGAIMTFADIALGMRLVDELGAPNCATQNLGVQFLSPGRVGEFIHCRPELVRCGRSSAVLRGLIRAGDRVIASVEGSWKIFSAPTKRLD